MSRRLAVAAGVVGAAAAMAAGGLYSGGLRVTNRALDTPTRIRALNAL